MLIIVELSALGAKLAITAPVGMHMPSPLVEKIKFYVRRIFSRAYRSRTELMAGVQLAPFFKSGYYLRRYPDVERCGIDPAAHYLLFGARELRNPDPAFDTAYYLANNPGIDAARINPLIHFLQQGWKRECSPNALFDSLWYVRAYNLPSGVNPLLHYLSRRDRGEDARQRPLLADLLREFPPAPLEPSSAVSQFGGFSAAAARLRTCGRAVVLHISHSLGGGVAEYLDRLCALSSGDAEFLLLSPSGEAVVLEALNPEYSFSLVADPGRDYVALIEALRRCGVAQVHIHHLQGHRLDVRRLCHDLCVPFDFTVHDYFALCPQVHLSGSNARYCGEPGESGCNACLSLRPSHPPRRIDEWRRAHRWLFDAASRVIAPSTDTALRIRRYIPEIPIILAAHPEPAPPAAHRDAPPLAADEPLRVVLLGELSRHKGLHIVRECATRARRRHLPLEFILVGQVDPALGRAREPFRQTGRYLEDALSGLIAETKPHLVWFPSQVPETYSFTLGSALRGAVPIVANDLGSMSERLSGLDWAWLIPINWDAERMLSFFVAIRKSNFLPHLRPERPHGPVTAPAGFYEREYLNPRGKG
jgi:glycosyltransferase involved in cell wall biosynthesis